MAAATAAKRARPFGLLWTSVKGGDRPQTSGPDVASSQRNKLGRSILALADSIEYGGQSRSALRRANYKPEAQRPQVKMQVVLVLK